MCLGVETMMKVFHIYTLCVLFFCVNQMCYSVISSAHLSCPLLSWVWNSPMVIGKVPSFLILLGKLPIFGYYLQVGNTFSILPLSIHFCLGL